MWPCFTTMNVQKLVYGPRSAVRGSGIRCPAVIDVSGRCATRLVSPHSVLTLAIPVKVPTRSDHEGHQVTVLRAAIFGARLGKKSSAMAAGRTEAQVSAVYIAAAARPGCAKVSVR
jgi:hypothetical protein